MAGNERGLSSTNNRRALARRDLMIAAAIVAFGLVISGISMMQLAHGQTEIAQVTQPQTAPSVPAGNQNGPAESKPGGTRPTTPAPEPAQPDADARKAGAQPALPSAPAEKVAPPIKTK
ncbi:MAG: hypothetical protein JSS22_05505 [Proteobacteria bacterium]|nr:hypothetical protein [Pseudomonadota bacterium]